jgi:hypothetical protein
MGEKDVSANTNPVRGAAMASHPHAQSAALQALQMLVSAGSIRSAVDAVQAPMTLAFTTTARAERHMRTARVSWW